MPPQISKLRRTWEHLLAAMVVAMPLNAGITFLAASLLDNPLAITLTTTLLATVISFVRTYLVISAQDERERALAAQ